MLPRQETASALYSSGPVSDPNSYPVFVPADWETRPVTVRLRRAANGDAEIIEIDGVAPNPRALLTADRCPPPTRPGASVEFGGAGVEAQATVEYAAFCSERVAQLVQAITDLRELVASCRRGPQESLDVKLQDALATVQAGDTGGACAALADFLNEVRAHP